MCADESLQMVFHIALLKMPLYSDITGRTIVYWFANIGVRDYVGRVWRLWNSKS